MFIDVTRSGTGRVLRVSAVAIAFMDEAAAGAMLHLTGGHSLIVSEDRATIESRAQAALAGIESRAQAALAGPPPAVATTGPAAAAAADPTLRAQTAILPDEPPEPGAATAVGTQSADAPPVLAPPVLVPSSKPAAPHARRGRRRP